MLHQPSNTQVRQAHAKVFRTRGKTSRAK